MTNKLVFTQLHKERLALAIRPTTRFIGMEGPARSSKTAIAIQAFYYRLFDSKDMMGCIAGRDLDAINNNILKKDVIGLLVTHPNLRMVRDKIGSYYIEMNTPMGPKSILLVGYSDKTRWEKILGGDIGVFLIDEANIADETFINETFARQLACESPLTIFTTNGDDPQHFIYQNYMNYGKVLGYAPTETLAQIAEFQNEKGKKPGYYYSHFRMSDNPVMTAEKLLEAESVFPVGSFYWQTKIKGIRAAQGLLIFADYLSPDKLLIDSKTLPYMTYTIGVDVAESKAYNVFVLTGWTKNYEQAVPLKVVSFASKGLGWTHKTSKLKEFLLPLKGLPVEGIFVDSAAQNYIDDLRGPIKKEYGMDVLGSYKATIQDRIDMMIIGFSTRRILIDRIEAKEVFEAYRSAKWIEKGTKREREDIGLKINDVMDATEYSLTRHMKSLMRNGVSH